MAGTVWAGASILLPGEKDRRGGRRKSVEGRDARREGKLAGAAGSRSRHYVGRDAAFLLDRFFELLHIDLSGKPLAIGFLLCVRPQAGVHAVDVVVNFDVERIAAPSKLNRLIDEHPRRADLHLVEEALDVFGIQPNASVADFHTDAPGHIGAMKSVFGQRQFDAVFAKGIVGIVASDDVLGLAVTLEMLLVNVLRHHPGRIASLAADGEGSHRRLPIETSETDRERVHYRRRHSA